MAGGHRQSSTRVYGKRVISIGVVLNHENFNIPISTHHEREIQEPSFVVPPGLLTRDG